jgi:hypothetical protein
VITNQLGFTAPTPEGAPQQHHANVTQLPALRSCLLEAIAGLADVTVDDTGVDAPIGSPFRQCLMRVAGHLAKAVEELEDAITEGT